MSMDPVPDAPATPLEISTSESEAIRHWGSIRSAEGTPSPMFTRLCIAIFNHFDATVAPANTNLMEPPKLAAIEEAMGIAGDGDTITDIQKFIANSGGTIDDSDNLIKVYLTVEGSAHVMTTRESANPVWHGRPAVTMESFVASQMAKLEVGPGSYWWELKKLVDCVPGLVDPVTREVFQYPMIPWSCFPQESIPEAVAKLKTFKEEILPAVTAWGREWGVALARRNDERRNMEQRNEEQRNQQSNMEQSNADALAIMAKGQEQQLQLRVMNMMHSQRMIALSNAYGYNTHSYY